MRRLAWMLPLLASCTIPLYSEYEIIRPAAESNRVLLPAPEGITDYSPLTAEAWNRTFNECIQIREWMSHEIAQRRAAASGKRWFFTVFSAAAAVASVTYSAITEEPKAEVLVPLGLTSGTSVVTLQQATVRDERLDSLQAVIVRMDLAQRRAVEAMQNLEAGLVSDDTISSRGIEALAGTMQQRLTDWQLLCQ